MILEIVFPVITILIAVSVVVGIPVVVIPVGSVIDFASFKRFQTGKIQLITG